MTLLGAACGSRRLADGRGFFGPRSGVIRVVTYNVAGLPGPVAKTDPVNSLPQISLRLNGFDLVLVQEDFWYHDLLAKDIQLPHRTLPAPRPGGMRLGDGLRRFSRPAFDQYTREEWQDCHGILTNGSDCMASKGFDVGTHILAPGVMVDVYNLHMEASHTDRDKAARRAQVMQLLDTIRARSADRAVIVAGDTNMRADDEANLQALLQGAGLRDACRTLGRGEPDRVDRVMMRGSAALELDPVGWFVDLTFVHPDGIPLSDHDPVVVDVRWRLVGGPEWPVAAH